MATISCWYFLHAETAIAVAIPLLSIVKERNLPVYDLASDEAPAFTV